MRETSDALRNVRHRNIVDTITLRNVRHRNIVAKTAAFYAAVLLLSGVSKYDREWNIFCKI